jgi:alkanesulfonate monooxygenase SsuD/methylene tetrahydromethanopterin reductase-like flavin-dependent oxidoreductase (luciferase family)
MTGPGPQLDEARAAVRDAAVAAGRDPAALGLQGQVRSSIEPDAVAAELAAWADAGATHVAVSTMGHGLATVDDHLAALAAISGVTAARS